MDRAHFHLLRSVHPTASGSSDGSAIESSSFTVTMDDTAAAPQHWLFAGPALPDRRNSDSQESTQAAAHSSANGQTNSQFGNNDHADDPLPGGGQGSPVCDHDDGSEGDHHADDLSPGSWSHNTGGNPDQIAEDDDSPGSWR